MNTDEHRLEPGTVDTIFYTATLERVRELSENAMLRPAPRKLHCVPVREFVLKPVSIAAKRIFGRIQVALLVEEIARDSKRTGPNLGLANIPVPLTA